jgi:putative NADH-flavin reductase
VNSSKVAVIGASGKTGREVVRQALERGHAVTAVCRDASAGKLADFVERDGFSLVTAPGVWDETALTQALGGCQGVVAMLVSVRELKATALVLALAKAAATNGVTRFVFTAGEVTAYREPHERYTPRQRLLLTVLPPLLRFTPISMTGMLDAAELVKKQPGWDWTIVRAPTLKNMAPGGYRLCELDEITGRHKLSRADYAACMLDSLGNTEHHRRMLSVAPAAA